MMLTDEQTLRSIALNHAMTLGLAVPEHVLEAAEKFYAFLKIKTEVPA